MVPSILLTVLAWSGVTHPDQALVDLLSGPDYETRVWADALLAARAADGLYPPTAAALLDNARTSPSPEVRARCQAIHARGFSARQAVAYRTLDAAAGGDWPAIDALWWSLATQTYDPDSPVRHAFHPDGVMHVGPAFPGDDKRIWPAYRRATRRWAAARLASGTPLDVVLADLHRMRLTDAQFCRRTGTVWDGSPVHLTLAAFRWDAVPYRPRVPDAPPTTEDPPGPNGP